MTTCCVVYDGCALPELRGFVGRVLYLDLDPNGYALVEWPSPDGWPSVRRSWHSKGALYIWDRLPVAA